MSDTQSGTGVPIGEPSEKAMSNRDADQEAAKRDDVDEKTTSLPAEVTDQLMDGSDQIFLAAFNNSQKDGLSKEAAMSVAWNSVKQGFESSQDGSWHRKQKPGDQTISSGVESSAN